MISLLAALGIGLLWTLAGLLLLLLVLLTLLLVLPIDLDGRLDSDLTAADWEAELTGSARYRLRLRFGWGLFARHTEGAGLERPRTQAYLLGRPLRRRPKKKARPKAVAKPTAKAKRKPKRRLPLPVMLALAEEGMGAVRRLWRNLNLTLTGDLTYGFADPSLTGFCEAFRWGAAIPVPLRLTPAFTHPCLTGWALLKGRLYGYQIALALLLTLKNPVIRRHLFGGIRFKPLRTLLTQGG